MFYIAYMRQIEYPIIGRGKQCEESCMNDLQFKFIFIFTLKNYGLKIKEYGQPLLTRYLGQLQQEQALCQQLRKELAAATAQAGASASQ